MSSNIDLDGTQPICRKCYQIQSDAGFDLDQLLPKENQTARLCAGLGRFGQEIEGCGFA